MTVGAKKFRARLAAQRLRDRLHYDPETGLFTWLKNRRRRLVGAHAGFIKDGYVIINVDGVQYMAHRLAVLYVTGSWPEKFIDHKNLNRSDNRWCNLRNATRTQNAANTRVTSNNKLGVKGVQLLRTGRYRAVILKRKHLGVFDTLEEAKAAYDAAALSVFGEFART